MPINLHLMGTLRFAHPTNHFPIDGPTARKRSWSSALPSPKYRLC